MYFAYIHFPFGVLWEAIMKICVIKELLYKYIMPIKT